VGSYEAVVSARAAAVGSTLPPRDVVALAGRLSAGTRLVADEPLKKSVHRLRFDGFAGSASVVVKRLSPRRAQANELVAERWLPAAGLEWACPRLRAAVHEPSGRAVWHIYEDVAGSGLDGAPLDPERIVPVVELIVELHTRFAGHALLPECRKHGEEHGIDAFTLEVGRSIDFLESIDPWLPRDQAALRDRLLGRLERLRHERDERARLLESSAGPDTLLHGDLWTTNTLVAERRGRLQPTLIDWDHVGVGPVTYDLSTFLYRFPSQHRPWILGRYREAAARRGRSLPDDHTLNALFETAEYARYACCLAEAALAASQGERWGFEQMAEIERWFTSLESAPAVDPGR
jgi:hypothetical protein